VPYLQNAVKQWGLVNPYTGEPFPLDLPATAFPTVCDSAVDKWHRECGERLRQAATPSEEHPLRRDTSDPYMHDAQDSQTSGGNAGTMPHHRAEADYFRRRRPMSYVHVPEPRFSQPTSHPASPETKRRVSSSSGSSLDDLPRGSGLSDGRVSPHARDVRSSVHLHPRRPPNLRRHSQSYHSPYVASVHDSDSELDISRASRRRHGSVSQTLPAIRRIPVDPPIPVVAPSRNRRAEIRVEEPRSNGIKRLANFILFPSDRQRSSSRERGADLKSGVRFKAQPPRTRASRSLSGESYTSESSGLEMSSKYAPGDSWDNIRARERLLDQKRAARERELRDRDKAREREEEIERRTRRDRDRLRPISDRRTSSHADIDRRRQEVAWDPRDRRRESRDLEREVRRNLTSDELDRLERSRYQGRGPSPTMTGVGGRRYPR